LILGISISSSISHYGLYSWNESGVARAEVFIVSHTGHPHALLDIFYHLEVHLLPLVLLVLPLSLFISFFAILSFFNLMMLLQLLLLLRLLLLLLSAWLFVVRVAGRRAEGRLAAQFVRGGLLGLLLLLMRGGIFIIVRRRRRLYFLQALLVVAR